MADESNDIIWISPKGTSFDLKVENNEYSRKHIGEVKENPRTSYSSGRSTSGAKAKGSTTSTHTSVSTSRSTKRVQDSNDTFTDLGLGGRDIPLECYFIGENHYTKAEAFIKALGEVGKSRLQLAYGDMLTVNVIDFKVTNPLKENINSTIVSVNFHETSPTTYPKSQKSKAKSIKNSVEVAKNDIAQTLDLTVKTIQSPTRLASFTSNFSSMLNKVANGLDTASKVSLNSIMSDILSQTPANNMFTIAKQLGNVMSKAARLVNHAKNEISDFEIIPSSNAFWQWQTLLNSLISGSKTTKSRLTQEEIDNLLINDSSASMSLISLGESLLDKDFETRGEAVEAAKNLKDLESEWTEHVESELDKIDELEKFLTRDNSLTDIIDSTANEILERSYKLKVEKRVILTEDETVIDLAHKYYEEDFANNPDETIDYLIKTNGFGDDNFFVIPRGTEVKIYV